jgi:hypothetical protein
MAVALAVVAAGCEPGGKPASTSPAMSASRTQTAVSSGAAAQDPSTPDCDRISMEYQPKLADRHVRCVLLVNADLTLGVSSDPAWSFVLRSNKTEAQQFREPTDAIGETGVAPLLADIDGDGTPELLVVIGQGGTGGEPMAVWRLTGPPPRFVRSGELFGFRRFYRTPEGYFGNYAHGSAVSGDVSLYRWVDNALTEVALLDVRVASAPEPHPRRDWVRNGNTLCALNTEDYPPGARAARAAALRAAGIDPATAQQRFCTQPWVATVYG